MLDIFADNWGEEPTINDGERMVHILTGNRADTLYAIVGTDIDNDELESEIRFALRRKYGNGCRYCGYEDVTAIHGKE